MTGWALWRRAVWVVDRKMELSPAPWSPGIGQHFTDLGKVLSVVLRDDPDSAPID